MFVAGCIDIPRAGKPTYGGGVRGIQALVEGVSHVCVGSRWTTPNHQVIHGVVRCWPHARWCPRHYVHHGSWARSGCLDLLFLFIVIIGDMSP